MDCDTVNAFIEYSLLPLYFHLSLYTIKYNKVYRYHKVYNKVFQTFALKVFVEGRNLHVVKSSSIASENMLISTKTRKKNLTQMNKF